MLPRRTRILPTQRTLSTPPWRRVAASLIAFALLSVVTFSLASAAGAKERAATQPTGAPKVYQASGHETALAHGVVNLAQLPTITPHAVTSVQTPPLPSPDALTPQQRQAYNNRMRKAAPTALPGAQPTKPASPSTASPRFVGGGKVPLLVKQFDGLNSTQANGGTGEAAIATDLSYVMEGTDNALAIYRASNGTLAYGPYSPVSFFAPVYHASDTFAYPQLYYDTMRDRWIVVYLEVTPSHTVTYLDVAVSQTTSPTQPSPGAQYNVYQFSTNFESSGGTNSYCDYETLGVDYWGLYVSCVDYRAFSFVGNTVLAINKAPLLTGGTPNTWYYNDAVKITNDAGPALVLSPATEEGVQDGEFVVATDAGYGSISKNLTVCALTNQSNIASIAPAFSCLHKLLEYNYSDPLPASQPGAPYALSPGYGTKQVYYKAGHLLLAWTSGYIIGLIGLDVIDTAQVRPVLSAGLMYDVEATQSGTRVGTFSNDDAYTPSIVGTDEDDIVLVYNSSGSSVYPSIYYTGRKASDPLLEMGQGGAPVKVIFGTHTTTAAWGKYAACAISLNSVTRGGVWCVGEYTGATADPGWNTRLYNLRAE